MATTAHLVCCWCGFQMEYDRPAPGDFVACFGCGNVQQLDTELRTTRFDESKLPERIRAGIDMLRKIAKNKMDKTKPS